MKKLCAICAILGLIFVATSAPQASTISLPDGTVMADRQDSGTGSSQWFGESVTTLTIDAQNVGTGQYVEVTGKITSISNTDTSWVEIGLIQKENWEYWQTAYGGSFKSAVFDKGIHVVHWEETDVIGLQLQEGWWEGGSTQWEKGPYAWNLEAPTTESPWEFTISMYPNPTSLGGDAYLAVVDETISGTQPLAYLGNQNIGDFSKCYLIAQIWSLTENASFSFEDVQATVVPIPGAVWLLGAGLIGLVGLRRKFR